MINEMRPRHLSALTLTLYPGTDLYQEWRAGRFQAATARDTLREARLLIEKLEVDPLHLHLRPCLQLRASEGRPARRPCILSIPSGPSAGERYWDAAGVEPGTLMEGRKMGGTGGEECLYFLRVTCYNR